MATLDELLTSAQMFSVLPEDERRRVAAALRSETWAKGEKVIAEGERGDTAYLIANGEAGVVTKDIIGEEITLRVFKTGEVFGEVALVESTPRTATVRALTDLEVYVLDRATYRQLSAGNPTFARTMGKHVDLLAVDRFLKKSSPFARVPDPVIRRVAGQLVSIPVKSGDVVVTEGEEGDRFYVIRSGQFEVIQGGRRMATLGEGDAFGEIALLTGGPRIATVTATTAGEVLALSKADFDAVVKDQATFGGQIGELARIRFRATTGQALTLPDPITTLMPYLKTKSRDRYWIALLVSITLFAASAYATFALNQGWAMLTTLVLGAFVVPIGYVVYMAESDILATRPGAIAFVFIVSAIAGIPISAGIQALLSVDWYTFPGALSIALIEEPIKVIAVLWFLKRSTFRFRMDGLVFGAAAGMGFAAFETLLFGIGYFNIPPVLVEALSVRSVLAPLGHGTWTAITCAVLYGENTRGRLWDPRVLGAFAFTITLHALWDWQPLGLTWYENLPWFLAIGVVGILALRFLVNRAAQEEVQSIIALNPELAARGRTGAQGVRCQRCEQVAPVGAHYCVRCGAALRVQPPAAHVAAAASVGGGTAAS